MRRYGGGILYPALPLHMQRGCFRIRTHDQQVTKAQLYRCTRARPQIPEVYNRRYNFLQHLAYQSVIKSSILH
ncbi:hypothetical protein JHK85_012034 [Glycine max]|nr:hypothetical protein JHK85_012034 [Glycine max]